MKLYRYDIALTLTVHIAAWSDAAALETAKRAVLTAQQHIGHQNTMRAVTDNMNYTGKKPQLLEAALATPMPSAYARRESDDA